MFIEINDIRSNGLALDGRLDLEESLLIEQGSSFLEHLKYKIHLSRNGQKIKAKGSVNTRVSLVCVKCLEQFELKVHSHFDVILFPGKLVREGNASLNQEDMEYIFFEGDNIDVEKILVEQVNLFIPYRPLCGPDCKGLCANCGANLNYENCLCDSSTRDIKFLFNKH